MGCFEIIVVFKMCQNSPFLSTSFNVPAGHFVYDFLRDFQNHSSKLLYHFI